MVGQAHEHAWVVYGLQRLARQALMEDVLSMPCVRMIENVLSVPCVSATLSRHSTA